MFSHYYLVSTEFLLGKQRDNMYFEPKYYGIKKIGFLFLIASFLSVFCHVLV